MLHVRETYSTREPFEQQQKKANEHGYKWTELLRLPYFEPSRFVTVDPMHCLFLGRSIVTQRSYICWERQLIMYLYRWPWLVYGMAVHVHVS